MPWDTVPSKATLKPKPFRANVSAQELEDLKQLLKLSKIGPRTYENLKDDGYFGISRDWLITAKQHWSQGYDWRKTEDRINALPNFTVPITHDGTTLEIHFAALFSQNRDAVPLILIHGWPGSFLEFIGAMELMKTKYSPEELPFHLIVPSMPGYAYSSGPPPDKNFGCEEIAETMDKLMVGLGFDSYIAQGGDIGAVIARLLVAKSDHCRTGHVNMSIVPPPHDGAIEELSKRERDAYARAEDFSDRGSAYARMHGTRPATIGLVLSSSPVALLAWIGEKFQQWTDQDPSLDEMLDSVTLYWFTESFARCIYPYRQFVGGQAFHTNPEYYMKKPFGYSWYPKELSPTPKDWVAKTGNMVWFKAHDAGGHFAAWERPDLFVEDMEDFVSKVWPTVR